MLCLALLLPVALASTACSRAGDGDAAQTVLVFSYDEGGELKEAILDELIADFEREHPELKIQRHPLPGLTDLERAFYMASLSAQSTFVDVFEADVIWISEFAAGGFLKPLDEFVDDSLRAQWTAPALEEASYDGKLYAVPYYITYASLFYRPSLMKKHGYSVPLTFDQLLEQAQAIAKAEGIEGLLWQGEQNEGLVCNFLQFYFNHGGELLVEEGRVKFDENRLKETLALMSDLMHKHEVTPTSILGHSGDDSDELFAKGKAAFMINTQAAALYIKDKAIGNDFQLAPLPGKQVALTGGFTLGISAHSAHPEKAFEFARFMAGERAQRLFLERRGQGPVLKQLYGKSVKGIGQLSNLEELARNTRARPRSPYYNRFSLMVAEEVRDVLTEDKTPAEGAEAIARRSNELDFPQTAEPDFPKEFIYWY